MALQKQKKIKQNTLHSNCLFKTPKTKWVKGCLERAVENWLWNNECN